MILFGEAKHIECGIAAYIELRGAQYIESREARYIDGSHKRTDGMTDKKDALREATIQFALEDSDVCETFKGCRSYADQIIRCSASIGANLFEAKYAQSRADFVHKLEISLKECSETEYWLELLHRKGKLSDEQFKRLNHARGTIQRMLISSITTAKKHAEPF